MRKTALPSRLAIALGVLLLFTQGKAFARSGRLRRAGGSSAQPTAGPKAVCLTSDASGYRIEVQRGHGDTGVLAAQLFFGSVAPGRSQLAGYADVTDQNAGATQNGMDLKSTSESPFQFELTISTEQDDRGAFDATLVNADLFTGAPLADVGYKCWFWR